MKRALCLLLVLMLIVPLSPRPAHAGCCDDFWGCVGAVVTGGLSCAIQEAVEAIDRFVRSVRDARDNGRRDMEAAFKAHQDAAKEAAREARDEMQKLIAEMDRHQKDAQKLVRDTQTIKALKPIGPQAVATSQAQGPAAAAQMKAPAATAAPGAAAKISAAQPRAAQSGAAAAVAGGGAGGAAPAPPAGAQPAPGITQSAAGRDIGGTGMLAVKHAPPSAMASAMREGEKQVAAERERMRNQKKQAMEQQARKAEADAGTRVAQLNQLLTAVFLAPLAGIIGFFVVGDPITLAVSIAVMATQLDNVKKALDEQMEPAVKNAAAEQEKLIDEMQKRAQEHGKDADKARTTVELMRKLAESRRQSDLEALEKHLGIKHASSVALAPAAALQTSALTRRAVFRGAALHVAAREQTLVASRRLRTDLDAPLALAAAFKKPTAPPVAGFQARVSTDLENHFRGRTGADLARKRDDLIAEARVYFARDPKTLQAVEKYLRDQAAARGGR
jgi:hypothetical protein